MIGVASLVAVIAGVNLAGAALPVPDTIVPSYISASEYTWIAIGVLYANALGRLRSDTRSTDPEEHAAPTPRRPDSPSRHRATRSDAETEDSGGYGRL